MLVGSVNMKNEGLIKKTLKKGVALLLSAAMTTTLFGAALPIKAQAATELQRGEGVDKAPTGENDNMKFLWLTSGDWGEESNTSYRYNFQSKNGDGSTGSVTFGQYGVPLYILMPKNNTDDGAKDGSFGIPGNRPAYNPNSLESGRYYMAKMGQRQAELSNGNAITGNNQLISPLGGPDWNSSVETTKFGSGSDERTIETMVKTTADEKYVYADYYFYGRKDIPTGGQRFLISMAYDFQVNNSLQKDVVITDRGFYLRKHGELSTFNVILGDPSIGANQASTKWIGEFSSRIPSSFRNGVQTNYLPLGGNIDGLVGQSLSNADFSTTFSWDITLRPYETVHRRVAYTYSEAAIYVSSQHGNDSNTGIYNQPLKTIEAAFNKANNKLATIFVQDYDPVSSTIVIPSTLGSNTKLTISSTDISFDAHSKTYGGGDGASPNVVLKRASGFEGAIFKNETGLAVNFDNITLDGDGRGNEALLKSSSGTINLNSGVKLTNSTGGALDITGGDLNLKGKDDEPVNPVSITGNAGTSDIVGAVKFAGSNMTVSGLVKIKDNTKAAPSSAPPGTQPSKANVYLASGKVVTVKDAIRGSEIGVTTQTLPTGSTPVVIAEPASTYPGGVVSPAPFLDRFDKDSDAAGIIKDTDSTQEKVVFKANEQTIKTVIRDNNGAVIAGSPTIADVKKPVGETVTLAAPPASFVSGSTTYTLDVNSSETYPTYGTSPFASDGTFTGIVPAEELLITYKYRPNKGSVTFNGNGGIPSTVSNQDINAGTQITAPSATKFGYVLSGWNSEADGSGTALNQVGGVYSATVQAGNADVYYAQWTPDTTQVFDLTAQYTNQDHSITFGSITSHGHGFSTPFSVSKKTVRGYEWSQAASDKVPSSLAGSFDSNGTYTGTMPLQDATVRYGYTVSTNPADRSAFKVYYRVGSVTGPIVPTSDATGGNQLYFPEENISYTPQQFMGYDISDAQIVDGLTPSPATATDNFVTAMTEYNIDSNYNFTGKMPNQQVTLVYVLTTNGSAVPYSVTYTDMDTTDELLRDIIPAKTDSIPVGTPFTENYRALYGYSFNSTTEDPAGSGTFNPITHDYDVVMPAGELQIGYKYGRVSSKWADITYVAGANGSITNQPNNDPANPRYVSTDVTSAGGGYKASVLINDGSAQGAANAYTFEKIVEKHLVPNADANQYYVFEGWFVDGNGDGIRNNGEALVANTDNFTGAATLTASFAEDPQWWGDIFFAAGPNGSINAGEPTSMHLTKDKHWSDVITPSVTPVANYIRDKWYDGNTAMSAGSTITLGNTYTFKFAPDPNAFGTDAKLPDAVGSINPDSGRGRITVYNTAQGYSYIVTETDGTIVATQDGNATGRNIFENLYPEHRYHVYEVISPVIANAGDNISSVSGAAGPTEVLIPALEKNYKVDFDEEDEAYTTLIVNPADPNSDYAVLDENGNVVITPETRADGWQTPTGDNPAIAKFSRLTYNGTYTVVARPRGSSLTPQDQLADGTTVVMDPNGELDIPKFIVETQRGSVVSVAGNAVGTNRFEEAHAGERVVLDAPASGFLYWKVTVGSIPKVTGRITERNFTFTMPSTNVLLTAYYAGVASPSNATVIDELRGGSEGEVALNPEDIENLSNLLTTPEDIALNQVNHADVTYKIVYKKGKPTSIENALIKNENPFNLHESAYTGAWSLDIDVERYVNGRKVDRDMSYAANAEFDTYIQLDRNDVDMLDYKLYEIGRDGGGNPVLTEIVMSEDPESTGGLFHFKSNPFKRYVLAYSKVFKLTFKYTHENTTERFKVRKGEAPADYPQYAALPALVEKFFEDSTGYEYTKFGWSKSESTYKAFDENAPLTRKTTVYSFYKSNKDDVDKARDRLNDLLKKALSYSDSYFLKKKEASEINVFIKQVAEFMDRSQKPSLAEINAVIDTFTAQIQPYEQVLDRRYNDYNNGTVTRVDKDNRSYSSTARSGGGTSGAGGKGRGTKADPILSRTQNDYHVGVNGNWTKNADGKWQFKVNGGIPVVSMWAWLVYNDGNAAMTGWYHFNGKAEMDEGWFKDNNEKWYYLDPAIGMMVTGWRLIDGKWYYFAQPWEGRSTGEMYKSETTPDGYNVDANGALVN